MPPLALGTISYGIYLLSDKIIPVTPPTIVPEGITDIHFSVQLGIRSDTGTRLKYNIIARPGLYSTIPYMH